jgi:hypothetical protein
VKWIRNVWRKPTISSHRFGSRSIGTPSGSESSGVADDSVTLCREGEVIFGRAIDAYGRIVEALERITTTPAGRDRIAKIGQDLDIVGNGIALLRELLDKLGSLRPARTPCRLSSRPLMSPAANDREYLEPSALRIESKCRKR